MVAATYALLAAAMLCVGGAPVTLPPCTLPGPWDIRCLPGCFLQVESGTCAPCPHGSFMEHTNTDHTCRRCRSCDGAGAGFEEGRPCSAPADAECRCRPGLHCVSPDCPLCSGQPLCPPGRQPGPPPEATSCVPCPPGSYSDSTSALPCREHTRCEDREMSTFINGTQEADAICKHQNNPMVLIGSCFFGVLVIVLTFLALFLYKRRDRCSCPIRGNQTKGLPTMNTLQPKAERDQPGQTVYNIRANTFQMGMGNSVSINGGEAEPLQTDGPDGEDLDPPSGE
uniref:Tumor necrosis factor receptor superfamily member 3-like n=1 Tax=Petromyzon marinus TaxID=7757 RepID=A0AAJ7TUD3_PETMA|nr:tumor necrosis factor receptor superfamily member 3-like [Petromyzon marinus]